MSTRHPDHHDRGLRNGVNGCLSPSEYVTRQEAVEHATAIGIESQAGADRARLVAEVAELRRLLGK